MERFDYLIIGGGVAGTTAAEAIRGLDDAGSVAVVSDEPHALYSRVLLPAYVKGEIRREQLFLRRPEDYTAKRIEFIPGETAGVLDTQRRTVRLSSGRDLSFGKLLIATGGRPRLLGIPGEERTGVSRFQTVADADLMIELLQNARRAVVVGGSFIALEYLEILVRRQIPVTLVIPHSHFFGRFLDAAGGELLQENFRGHGIEVVTRERIAAIAGDRAVRGVGLATGRTIGGDFIGAGIGLDRNAAWFDAAHVERAADGVATDEFLETTVPGIFAAGDVAAFQDRVLGFRHTHGNWGNAFRQGDRAGRTMAHPASREPYLGVTSYGIRNLGFSIALVGHVGGGEGIEAVSTVDPAAKTYRRLFLRQGRLVGAALINRHEDRPVITTLIRDAVPISASARSGLAHSAFDIASLVP